MRRTMWLALLALGTVAADKADKGTVVELDGLRSTAPAAGASSGT